MAETEDTPHPLGPRFHDALALAVRVHGAETKRGTAIPYLAHIFAVVALVLEYGGDEDQAIGALLHDAIEDAGAGLRPEIARFGTRVAVIVEGCTDSDEEPKPPWIERKMQYLTRLGREEDTDVLFVSLADKLANVRAITADYRRSGDRIFVRLRGGKEGTLWYYRALADVYSRRDVDSPLCQEYGRAVAELERMTGTSVPTLTPDREKELRARG